MRSRVRALLVVAHPDDETLFFGGMVLSEPKWEWTIACVTDANADGQGKKRLRQFASACKTLGASYSEALGLPDRYNKRLDADVIDAWLETMADFDVVFTHGILGEYFHPHHQDVSFAVHRHFLGHADVWSPAYNAFPQAIVRIEPKSYRIKTKILSTIYFSETQRFFRMLPALAWEGFVKLNAKEITAWAQFLREGKRPRVKDLKTYGWLWPYFSKGGGKIPKRPF